MMGNFIWQLKTKESSKNYNNPREELVEGFNKG